MGWTVWDRIPVGTRFSAHLDQPWGPPSPLYNGYRVFPGGKVRLGRAADHSPPSSAMVKKEYRYSSTNPLGHTGPVMGSLYVFHFLLWIKFSSSSSSSVGPIANATDVLQPSWLTVLTLSPQPVWTFPHLPPGTLTSSTTRDPGSERWNCVGENWPVILPEIATSMSIQESFKCGKSATWDPRLYFLLKEGVLRIFSPCKILAASAGFEPPNLGT